jgi:putative hydrolase of the HAD superfamily
MIALDLEHRFDAHLSIDHMRVFGQYAPKPSKRMLRQVLARQRVRPRDAILVEDSALNLKAAKAIGMRTVLVRGYTRAAVGGYLPAHVQIKSGRASYVDCLVHSIAQLQRVHWLRHG